MNENLLLQQNEDFIVNFTKSIIINIKQYTEVLEDIFQQARISFLMALRNFDPSFGTTLQTYSKIYIKRDIFRLLGSINVDKKRYKNFTDIEESYS